MSLFGDDVANGDQHAPARSQPGGKSLFDDVSSSTSARPKAHSNTSLFADDNAAEGDSPWSLPTPKKAARSEMVRNLLPPGAVPDSYVDAFDAILGSGERSGANVGNAGVRKLLDSCELGSAERTRLVGLVAPDGAAGGLERGAFNVLLALIGLAQEGEEASLDGVDERRKSMIAQLHLPAVVAAC